MELMAFQLVNPYLLEDVQYFINMMLWHHPDVDSTCSEHFLVFFLVKVMHFVKFSFS